VDFIPQSASEVVFYPKPILLPSPVYLQPLVPDSCVTRSESLNARRLTSNDLRDSEVGLGDIDQKVTPCDRALRLRTFQIMLSYQVPMGGISCLRV